MSSYKKYMDRIKVDGEQHEKLLEAVRAAEEKQNSGSAVTTQPAKVRRFPLKRFGWTASAAAVIVLLVAVVPKTMNATKQAAETFAADHISAELTAKPETKDRIEEESKFSPAAEPADMVTEDAAYAQTGTAVPQTEAPTMRAMSVTQATNATKTQTAAPTDGKNGTAQTDEKAEIPEEDSLSIRKKAPGSEETVVYTVTCASAGATDFPQNSEHDLYSLFMTLKLCLEDAGPSAAAEPAADYRFSYNGAEFSYDSEEGLIWSDGREYALNESEQDALNSLLGELLTTE